MLYVPVASHTGQGLNLISYKYHHVLILGYVHHGKEQRERERERQKLERLTSGIGFRSLGEGSLRSFKGEFLPTLWSEGMG